VTTNEVLEALAPYVPLFQTILWIVVVAGALFLLRCQCRGIISAVITRIRGGSSFRAGPLELGADLKSLEYAPPNTSNHEDDTHGDDWSAERTALYQHNRGVFLTHIISPSTKPGQKYDIFIYLIRHKTSDFNDVERAEFFFGHMWGNTVFEERENNGMIGVSTSAYGPFLCTCRVFFRDGGEIRLNRYIDFEMGRAFDRSHTPRLSAE